MGLCDEKGVPVLEVRAGVMAIDVAAGQLMPVLRRLTLLNGMVDRRIWLAHGLYDLTGGDPVQLDTKGLKLVGEAGGEQPEIRRDADGLTSDADSLFAVTVRGEGVEITNFKVSNHGFGGPRNDAVTVSESGSATLTGCDRQGRPARAGASP